MKKVYILVVLLSLFCVNLMNAQTGSTCASAHVITSLPFDSAGLSTAGTGDNYDTSPCSGAASYMSGNDYVFEYTPTVNELVNVTVSNVSAMTGGGLFITVGCPDTATACFAEATGIMTDLNTTVNFIAGTTYYIVVSSQFLFVSGQTTSFDISMQVCNGVPVADFTYTADNTTITFTNTSQNAVSCNWLFGDEPVFPIPTGDTTLNPVHNYAQAGTYIVTLEVTNDCGSTNTYIDTIDVTCNLSSAPVADFSYVVNDTIVTFTNTSTDATSYLWFYGDEPVFPFPTGDSTSNPVHNYAEGSYTVELIAQNCFSSDTATVTFVICHGNLPSAAFSYSVTGLDVQFTSTATDATSYGWYFGDEAFPFQFTSTDANPTHTYTAYGDFEVTFVAINSCTSDTIIDTLHLVCPGVMPVASFTQVDIGGGSYTFDASASTDVDTYSWYFDYAPGLFLPSQDSVANPTHQFLQDGTFNVYLIVSNECGTDTFISVVTVIGTNVELVNNDSRIYCFPNPVKDVLTIVSQNYTEKTPVYIYNVLGEIVYQTEIFANTKKQIQISTFSKGVYYLKAGNSIHKIIVE